MPRLFLGNLGHDCREGILKGSLRAMENFAMLTSRGLTDFLKLMIKEMPKMPSGILTENPSMVEVESALNMPMETTVGVIETVEEAGIEEVVVIETVEEAGIEE